MKEEAFLLINEKDWLDRETKEMLLEKLAFLNFDFTINKGIANKKYYEYCINAIPFDSSKLPQEAIEDIKNYINVYSHRLKFDEISCYELIGHEILHAFDTNNRLIDQYGNSKKITTEKSDKELKTREQCLIDQYSSQTIEGINKKVNGTATLDENLGDNGSIKLAYRTYLKYVKRLNYKMKPLKGKKKLSSNQLFFISGARFYCYKRSKESLIEQQEKDEHTTEKNRLMTSLSNFNPFAKAFNCKIGTPMNPKNKCEVWRHK
uniref:Peptidase_M13 domain-containing protein n=1 Tax=Parastrongyloides trichosuri TaxID=131310 RepID=A0A0N4ZHN5_PARTI